MVRHRNWCAIYPAAAAESVHLDIGDTFLNGGGHVFTDNGHSACFHGGMDIIMAVAGGSLDGDETAAPGHLPGIEWPRR